MITTPFPKTKFTEDNFINKVINNGFNLLEDNDLFNSTISYLAQNRIENYILIDSKYKNYNSDTYISLIKDEIESCFYRPYWTDKEPDYMINFCVVTGVKKNHISKSVSEKGIDWKLFEEYIKSITEFNVEKIKINNPDEIVLKDEENEYTLKDAFCSDYIYFVNNKNACVIIYPDICAFESINIIANANKLTNIAMTYLSTLIPQILENLFADKPITDREKELFNIILSNNDSENAIKFFNEEHSKIDKDKIIIDRINKFESRDLNLIINNKKHYIAGLREKCEDLMSKYRFSYEKIIEENEKLKHLYRKVRLKEQSDLYERIKSLNGVVIEDIKDDYIELSITTIARTYDADEFIASLYDCKDSPLNKIVTAEDSYSRLSIFNKHNISNVRMLTRELFINESIYLRLMTKIKLFANGRFEFSIFNHGDEMIKCNALLNPHLTYYHCLGGNAIQINQLMAEHNYSDVIEYFISACSNVNFADYTVMKDFIRILFSESNSEIKFIELKDGRLLNIIEAVDYLKNNNCYNIEDEKFNYEEDEFEDLYEEEQEENEPVF